MLEVTVAFVLGLALGSLLTYNSIKHPGKIEGQLKGLWAKVRKKDET